MFANGIEQICTRCENYKLYMKKERLLVKGQELEWPVCLCKLVKAYHLLFQIYID